MTSDQVLTVSHLAKAYRAAGDERAGCIRVLRDVTFSVRRGEFITIGGTRGAGKTTLLLCASGLLRPDLGTVRWPALAPGGGRAPTAVAYVGSRAPLYAFLTVRESLAYAATVREMHAPGTTRGDAEPLEWSGLAAHALTRVGLLQRGEQARFLIALALVGCPQLMLVDDLTAGLDAGAHAAFAESLARVAAQGIGVVWGTRTPEDVAGTAVGFTLVDGWLRVASSRLQPQSEWIHPVEAAKPRAVAEGR